MSKKSLVNSLTALTLTGAVLLLPILNAGKTTSGAESDELGRSAFNISDKSSAGQQAPEVRIPKSDETVTFIVTLKGSPLCDQAAAGHYANTARLILSPDCRSMIDVIKKDQAVVKASIKRLLPDADFENSYTYNTVLSGFTVQAPYSSLEKLSAVSGVEKVYLSSSQNCRILETESPEEEPEETPDSFPISDASLMDLREAGQVFSVSDDAIASMTAGAVGAQQAYDADCTGKGQLIAVIDDGFACGHEVFSALPPSPRYAKADVEALSGAVPFCFTDSEVPYYSEKIVFAFDYAGQDRDVQSSGSHGTAVAGLAAGNNGETGKEKFTGIAYDSQLILMKVCADGEEHMTDAALLAALDDCAKLSPDVLNLSFGIPRTTGTAELFDRVYQRLSSSGTVLSTAAGNDGVNLREDGPQQTAASYTDYGTIAYPSSLSCASAVGASRGNTALYPFVSFADGAHMRLYPLQEPADSDHFLFPQTPWDYLYKDSFRSLGSELLSGKVLVTDPGDLSPEEAAKKAADLGAGGLLLLSGNDLTFEVIATEKLPIPVGILQKQEEPYFQETPEGKLQITGQVGYFAEENIAPASFTAYGVTADLRLKPDILAPGTDLYCASLDGYRTLSGTSGSAALFSGGMSVIEEYIRQQEWSVPGLRRDEVAKTLLMNTARLLSLSDEDFLYSPRVQGAGVMQLSQALKAKALLTSEGTPVINGGNRQDGVFTFPVEIRSLSDEPITYRLSTRFQTDKLLEEDGTLYTLRTPYSLQNSCTALFRLRGKEVKEVTLQPGETLSLEAEVTMDPSELLTRLSYQPNGFYLDGFLFLEPEQGQVLHLPMLAYCGSWAKAALFDQSLYKESPQKPAISGCSLMATAALGSAYPSLILGQSKTDGTSREERISIGRDTVRNYLDTTAVGNSFLVPNLYLLRDAVNLTFSINDAKGASLYQQNVGTASAFAGTGSPPYARLLGSINADGLKNLFAELKEGQYTCSVSAAAVGTDGAAAETQTISFPFTVDNTPPVNSEAQTYLQNGRIYLKLHAADLGGINGFELYTATVEKGKIRYADRLQDLIKNGYISEDAVVLVRQESDETTATYVYDITRLESQLSRLRAYDQPEVPMTTNIVYRAIDYAYNLSEPASAETTVSSTVSVTLTDEDGDPVEGVVVQLYDQRTTSNSSGEAVFDEVPMGLYELHLVSLPEGYETDYTGSIILTNRLHIREEIQVSLRYTGPPDQKKKPAAASETPAQNTETVLGAPAQWDDSEHDHSFIGLGVLGGILLFCALSLYVRRRKRLIFAEELSDSPEASPDAEPEDPDTAL